MYSVKLLKDNKVNCHICYINVFFALTLCILPFNKNTYRKKSIERNFIRSEFKSIYRPIQLALWHWAAIDDLHLDLGFNAQNLCNFTIIPSVCMYKKFSCKGLLSTDFI